MSADGAAVMRYNTVLNGICVQKKGASIREQQQIDHAQNHRMGIVGVWSVYCHFDYWPNSA
jgi:hypothetical protein